MAAALNQQTPEMDLPLIFFLLAANVLLRRSGWCPWRTPRCSESQSDSPLAGPGCVSTGRSRQSGLHVCSARIAPVSVQHGHSRSPGGGGREGGRAARGGEGGRERRGEGGEESKCRSCAVPPAVPGFPRECLVISHLSVAARSRVAGRPQGVFTAVQQSTVTAGGAETCPSASR